jgi:hypothetical protein
MKKEQKHIALSILQAIPVAALFVALMAGVLYYYPDIDYSLYRINPDLQAVNWLTVYHPLDFGWIHIPSLGLGIWFCFVLWLVPRLSGMMVKMVESRIVTWELQRRLAQLDQDMEMEEEQQHA